MPKLWEHPFSPYVQKVKISLYEKNVPFEQAPMGTTGLETAFAALHTDLVLPGVLDLATSLASAANGGDLPSDGTDPLDYFGFFRDDP